MSSRVYLFVAITCLLGAVQGQPTRMVSYIDDLNISYENGQWICYDVECPAKTFGCRIQRYTDDQNKLLLNAIYTCFDEQKVGILAAADSLEMSSTRNIDIDIESYTGAVSVYTVGYGLGGHENARGTISLDNWEEFKESARQGKKAVEDSNARID